MADEIAITLGMTAQKNNVSSRARVGSGDLLIDWNIAGKVENVMDVGTSATALSLGGVSTPGISFFHNVDGDNFVEIGALDGSGNFVPVIKLKPGEIALTRLGTSAPQARFDTAQGRLLYKILED